MAIFEPINNVRTDMNDNVFINVNRYQKKTEERRGFLRTEVQQNTVAATSRKGIEIYRRNNELNSRTNVASDQNAATFQLTFSGILSQQQGATTSVNTQISENTQTLQQETTEQSTGLSLMYRALQQYQNLKFGVKNITDLLNRGIDVYQKTLNLAPALTNISQTDSGESGQFGIEIPQTMNTIRSNGIAEYLIFNTPAEKNTNPFDLYLKAGPMRMLETQLFI